MKKFLISFFMVASLVMVIACSTGLEDNIADGEASSNGSCNEIGMEELSPEVQTAIRKFGTSPKVFKQKTHFGRFYTGQKVRWYEGDQELELLFEAYLVEFDSLNSVISDYLNTLTKDENNAWTHQDYEDVKFIRGKKYVEFSTYKVYEAGKDSRTLPVYEYETRTFLGDAKEDFNPDNGWYAKSVRFDPTLTIDVDRRYNIVEKKEVNYESNVAPKKYIQKEVPKNDYSNIKYFNHIKNFGSKINKIYQNYEAGTNKPTGIYLVEFDDIYPDVKAYIKGSRFWANKWMGNKYSEIITSDTKKTYLEFEEFTEKNYNTKEEWQSCILRLKEPDKQDWYGDVFTWCCDVNYDGLIKVLNMHNYTTKVIDAASVPEIGEGLAKIGTISKVYKNVYQEYPDEKIYLVEYSDCPNLNEINKYLTKLDNVVNGWTEFKDKSGNIVSVNDKENLVQVKKVVYDNGNEQWYIYKKIGDKIYQCDVWNNNSNEFFELLSKGKVKDFVNVKNELESEIINNEHTGKIYESENPILIKDESYGWYQSFLVEYDSLDIGKYEKIREQKWTSGNYSKAKDKFDESKKYVEVGLSGRSDKVWSYSLKIKNNDVWDIVFEDFNKEQWYDFLGRKYDPMNDLFSNFGEISKTEIKNDSDGNTEYFVTYNNFRNEEVLNTYILENGESPTGNDFELADKTLCFIQCKDNDQLTDQWCLYKKVNGELKLIKPWTGLFEDFYNATGVVTKDVVTLKGNEIKQKLQTIDKNVNSYYNKWAELIVGTGKVSYLFEFNKNKINLKNEDNEKDYTHWCCQGHLNDNEYNVDCRYVEVVAYINTNNEIVKYRVFIRNASPKTEDGYQCWSQWKDYTPAEFDKFVESHKA